MTTAQRIRPDKIAARAFRTDCNKFGNIHPQQGLTSLCARMIERGRVLTANALEALRRAVTDGRIVSLAVLSLLCLVCLLSPTPIQAQIYRCIDANGQQEFSDLPCADDAELIELSGNMSVIEAADSLDAAARSNRQFIDRRRAELTAQRQAAERQRRDAAQQGATAARALRQQQQERSSSLSRYDRQRLVSQRRAARFEAEQRRREQAAPERPDGNRRSTLLSRSGSSRERILD